MAKLFLISDIRYACRSLLDRPFWTLAALLCLALGTGANTAGLSIINAVLLRPLPFPESQRIVAVNLREANPPMDRPFALDEYRELAPEATLFSDLCSRTFLPVSVKVDGPARMVQTELVSENYFAMLRVAPMIGRVFASGNTGEEAQAVISERLWRNRFGGDLAALGRRIQVNGRGVIVVGVAPAGFIGATQLIAADMWMPASLYAALSATEPATANARPMFGVLGRLKPGVSRDLARLQLDALLAARTRSQGTTSRLTAGVEPATGLGFPGSVRLAVVGGSAFLFCLMGLVMCVAVANVAGLMLARMPGRRREIGVRLALGASPSRIAQQVLAESLVLGLAGSAAGALLAVILTNLAPALGAALPEHLSYAVDVQPDWRVMFYAAVTALMVSLLFGLAPALQAARTSLIEVLKQSGTASRTGATARSLSALVIGQMAVSTVLLAGCGLLTRTYLSVRSIDPGMNTVNVAVLFLDLTQAASDTAEGQRFYQRLLERTAGIPGVEAVSLTREVPLSATGGARSVSIGPLAASETADIKVVSPAFFETLRIPLLQGRDFSANDRSDPQVTVVNETMARRFWPGASPIGQTFRVTGDSSPLEVIGVVRDVKSRSLSEMPRPVFYRPLTQVFSPQMALLVRSSDLETSIRSVRREVQAANSSLALVSVRTMRDFMDAAIAQRRNGAGILAVIGGLGLLLSSIGLFGVISFAVRERTREFGLRMALGAPRGAVLRTVLRQGMRLALIGFAIGAPLSLGFTRLLAGVLVGVGGQDPVTVGVVGIVLTAVALVAAFLPARWATQVDPAVALRNE